MPSLGSWPASAPSRIVLDAFRHRPDLVEGTRERRHAEPADAPVARLDPDTVAEARRLADGAARVRPQRGDAQIAPHGRGASARTAARDARRVVGIARDAQRRILRRAPHGELVHVDASGRDEIVREKLVDDGRVVGRNITLQNLRAASAGLPGDVDEIFDRDGYGFRICRGAPERILLVECQIRADATILRMVAVDNRLHKLHAREIALGEPFSRRLDSKFVKFHDQLSAPSTIFGSRNSSWIRAGALASATSRASEGDTTSSRKAFTRW